MKTKEILNKILFLLFFAISSTLSAQGGGSGSGSGSGSGTGNNNGPTAPKSVAATKADKPNSASEIKAYADKDGDGEVTQEEIMETIDATLDGETPYSIEEVQGLIDNFFD